MIIKKISPIISFCFATILAFLPFNFLVGSKAAWFSYSSMVIPAIGYQYSLLYVILYFFTKAVFTLPVSLLFFARRLPLLCATIALRFWDIRVSVIFPLIAMVLFCMHPVGSQVFYYSWYWFIPIFIYFFGSDSLFNRAITASFIAHATGSIVWLYLGNIPAEQWIALIPIVFIERVLIAIGMFGCVILYQAIDEICQDKVKA